MKSCLVSKQLIALDEINYVTPFDIQITFLLTYGFRVE